MYHHSSINSKTFMENSNLHSRETAFDPLNYEFDADTMIVPFSYFHDGPAESRRKSTVLSPISSSLSNNLWSSASSVSPSEENSQIYYHQYNNMFHLNSHHHHYQQQQQQNQYPKTICRHCKSHNMPECLYTSHSMYDESGEIFCPVLKKCHCANCIRVINSNERHDDDSDDDNHLRCHFNDTNQRDKSYRLNNNNDNF